MKYLLDANLSPQVVGALQAAGHSASYVGDHRLLTATVIGNLSTVEPDLASGAIVSLSPTRLRIRTLPIE